MDKLGQIVEWMTREAKRILCHALRDVNGIRPGSEPVESREVQEQRANNSPNKGGQRLAETFGGCLARFGEAARTTPEAFGAFPLS